MLPLWVFAQEEIPLPDFSARWEALSADPSIPPTDQLLGATELLHEASRSIGWMENPVWEWVQITLDLWEESAEVQLAREQYVSILTAIGRSLEQADHEFEEEARLREYYERALSLDLSPVEEGILLLYLAESWLRTTDLDPVAMHQAESLLQQASDLLGAEVPMDIVHMHLGELALAGEGTLSLGDDAIENVPNFTQAVYHFQAIKQVRGAREPYLAVADRELKHLLEPKLECATDRHFLPQNDIRITVRTRNIPYLEVELVPLSALMDHAILSLAALRKEWMEYNPAPEQILIQKRFPVRTRNPSDWTESAFSLGDEFVGGWYGLRVTGSGEECKEILLVTPLELVALERKSGDLAVWVADVESGLPLPGAAIQVLDAQGELLANQQTGANGFTLVAAQVAAGWSELQVLSQLNPGYVQREAVEPETEPIPWVIPGCLQVRPGESLSFCLFGFGPEYFRGEDSRLEVLLPDGNVVDSTIQFQGESWIIAEVQIPEDTDSSGPLYVRLPGMRHILLSHVDETSPFPLEVEFVGDQFRRGTNLFFNSSTPEVRLNAAPPVWDSLPQFLRVRITRLDRARSSLEESSRLAGNKEVLMEKILSVKEAQTSGTLFPMVDVPDDENVMFTRVEVFSLDGEERYGIGYAALVNYRTLVNLESSEKIVHTGDTVEVNLKFEDVSDVIWRLRDGDLVLYRETWESRYIHRKKGNMIPESEYGALPDRSLLGAAKTDYRLAEQGFVREEIQRIPVNANSRRMNVPIVFDRSGYYRIVFESPDPGITPTYRDGSLEVWVLPKSGDLHAFRTEEPRVVMESRPDGTYDSLLLLDRNNTSVLMDFEHEDGTSFTDVIQSIVPAVAYHYVPETDSPLIASRFVVVGDRKTDFLWEKFRQEESLAWELGTNRLFGVNPGAEFVWPLALVDQQPETPVFWAFFPETATPLLRQRMEWQVDLHKNAYQRVPVPAMLLEKVLPLFHPLQSIDDSGLPAAPVRPPEVLSATDILSLYPELSIPDSALADASSRKLNYIEPPVEEISGLFPESAGRWHLVMFSQSTSDNLDMEEWLVSTELSIRSHLGGPPFLRESDKADLRLQLNNTTLNSVELTLDAVADGSLHLLDRKSASLSLAGRSGYEVFYPIEGISPGEGTVRVQTTAPGTSVESVHTSTIYKKEPASAWKFLLVQPQEGVWRQSVDFPGWEKGTCLVASGLGSLLPELWPLVRDVQKNEEPLMVALGDWALARIIERHGLGEAVKPIDSEKKLLKLLSAGQADDGGWSWTPGQPSDPWLSGLVLWSLGSFAGESVEAFDSIKESAKTYLENALISDSLGREDRLFALRALSVEALHSRNSRPTRIQARSFLDFLYERSTLSRGELAILLEVARAFAFREEVLLLESELRQTRDIPNRSGEQPFLSESLVFLALYENSGSEEENLLEGLDRALETLAVAGPARGWGQVAGMLNLMSAFYWKGEFNTDGYVQISFDKQDPVELMLNPDLSHTGLYLSEMDDWMLDGTDIEVNTAFALSPVIIAFIGTPANPPIIPEYPDYTLELFREYEERTLLSGTRKRLDDLGGTLDGLTLGDVLRVRLTVTVDTPIPYAEFCFPIPAGMVLDTQATEYHWISNPQGADSPAATPVLSRNISENGYCRDLRIEPLSIGQHVFELPYKLQWMGTFSWPDNHIHFPRSGQSFSTSNVGPVEINRPETEN